MADGDSRQFISYLFNLVRYDNVSASVVNTSQTCRPLIAISQTGNKLQNIKWTYLIF